MNANSEPVYILGISCFYHDSAAALIKDGVLVAAASEERFTRKKHDDGFPANAARFCLERAGITIEQVSYVGFYDKPLLKFERVLKSFVSTWPFGYIPFLKAIPSWLRTKLFTPRVIKAELGYIGPVYFAEHHMSHAASAFYVSPFKDAAVLTVDGVGEWATASWGRGMGSQITIEEEMHYPDSLGLFYSLVTHYLGFKPNDAEYKVMGLAPYGTPRYVDRLKRCITIHADGSTSIHPRIARHYYNVRGLERVLAHFLEIPPRTPESELEQIHKDIAASLQSLTNEAMVKMATYVRERTGAENLCMAGGVALNCVANSEILRTAGFKNMWIQPAAGDAGGALGAAFWIWHHVLGKPRSFEMRHCFWGPEWSDAYVEELLKQRGIPYDTYDPDTLVKKTAELIAGNEIVGWFQGRMEWGPRSLGARSILADARNKENWQRVNLKIKFRESFRPFAPSVLAERSAEYFDFPRESPYMLFTAPVRNDAVPAVTHVDKTARLQTVSKETPLFHELIAAFDKLTGCPVIINTSFNVRSEPIVCSPEDALDTFFKTDMDYLVLGTMLVDKKACGAFASDIDRAAHTVARRERTQFV